MSKQHKIKDYLYLKDLRHSLKLLRAFNKYIYRYWKLELAILIFGNLSILLSLSIPYLGKLIVDNGILAKDLGSLIGLSVWSAGIFNISLAFSVVFDYLKNYTSIKVEDDLNRDIFKKIKAQKLAFLQQTPAALNLFRITNDISSASHIINSTLVNFMNALLKIIFITIIILFINPLLLFIVLVSQILAVIKWKFLLGPMRDLRKKSLEISEDIYEALNNFFSHIYLIKAFGTAGREILKYMHSLFKQMRLNMKMARISALSDFFTIFYDKLFFAIFAFFLSLLVIKGKISFGSMAASLLYITQGIAAYSSLTEMINQFLINRISLERVTVLLQEPVEVEKQNEIKLFPQDLRRITFSNVTFGYFHNRDILENMNFSIEPGSRIGLTGPSGCGKTTTLNLILGLYQPAKGKILLGDNNLEEIDQKFLLEKIGIALQESFLFNDTIANNIAYGLRQATQEEIMRAVHLAGIESLIESLPKGLDTVIGDNAYLLSEGQKQRIAIARALIKKPQILILDEAMSSLDSDSEEKIIKAIKETFEGSTLIVVSHRLSTLQKMDMIYFFESPKIMHIGFHDKLVRENLHYRELLGAQLSLKEVE